MPTTPTLFESSATQNGEDGAKDDTDNRKHVRRVGWIPEEWDAVTLGELLSLSNGKSRPDDMRDQKTEEYTTPVFGGNGVMGYAQEQLVEGPRIIIGRVGALCGVVHLAKGKYWVSDNAMHTQNLEALEVPSRFLRYLLDFSDLGRYRQESSQPLITQRIVKQKKVPLPPPEEQTRIARILSIWDRAIEQVDALIEQKRERLHGLRQRLLTGEVRFPEFDKPWVDEEIGSLLKRVYRYVDWDDEATYDLVSIKRDSQGMIFRESLKGSDIKTKTLNTLKEADFVISRMQVVHGATAYVSEEFDGMKASDSYIILVPRDEDRIDTEFFAELSKLPYLYHIAFTSSYGVHIEKMTFNLEWYFESEVHIPPSVEEQRKIVSFLNEVKSEINTLEEKRDALQRQKKGLMQRLLTGAVRTV
jgi:type I restriction enzyme S subunit